MSNNKTFADRAVSAGMEDRLPDPVRVALADAAREVAAAGGPVTYLELCYVDANRDPETGETSCEAPASEDAADFSAVYFRSAETCDSTMLACDLEGLSPRAVAAACRALARQYGVPVLDRRLTTHDATPNGCAFHPEGVYGPVTGASRAPRPDWRRGMCEARFASPASDERCPSCQSDEVERIPGAFALLREAVPFLDYLAAELKNPKPAESLVRRIEAALGDGGSRPAPGRALHAATPSAARHPSNGEEA